MNQLKTKDWSQVLLKNKFDYFSINFSFELILRQRSVFSRWNQQ